MLVSNIGISDMFQCLSVCPSHADMCVKTNDHRIMWLSTSGSPGTRVFWH